MTGTIQQDWWFQLLTTSAFSTLGYTGIKRIIDDAGIDYSKKTIVQVSHLKLQIESLGIKRDKHTIFSLDIKAFYPSVMYGLVKRAINFLSRSLGEKEKGKIKECLKMVAFGMGNTLLTFVDKYYKYDGKREIQDKGPTIRGYKLAWLTNLVAAFVLENCKDLFDDAVYDGIYRDDGLVIMNGQKTNADIGEWIKTFQKRVSKVTVYKGLVFTVSIWRGKGNDKTKHPKAGRDCEELLPLLRYGDDLARRRRLTLWSLLLEAKPIAEIPKEHQLTPPSLLQASRRSPKECLDVLPA
jgi:hypothetical protein